MSSSTRVLSHVVLVASGLAVASCSGYKSPTSPMPVQNGATITLTSTGISPSSVTVLPGGDVTFVNQDTVDHRIASNPHPTHTQCPELNGATLAPGASFTAMMANKTESCGFHDHLNPSDTRFQGSIQVMTSGY